MTTAAFVGAAETATPCQVTVLLSGAGVPGREAMQTFAPADWCLARSSDEDDLDSVQIVVVNATRPGAVHDARSAWPRAAVVAVVPEWDDATLTVAALEAGAEVCVRGSHPAIVAAYLVTVARRWGLPLSTPAMP